MSYCWGDVMDTVSLQCNGMPFLVTRNSYSALKRLRRPHKQLQLWVDAMCINQYDTAERNSQVSMMRHIYADAEQVDVWLGSGSESTQAAAHLIETMAMQ